jgi:LacI family transcriptional regulator
MKRKQPTVIDVAKRAQVGASTVSRFLRGVTVRPEVAERVARAVESLGYQPDETARTLRGGRSRTIGVVLPKVSNVFFSQSVQVIEEEARKRGCAVILLTHQDRLPQQTEHLRTLRRYRVDGVLITATPGTTATDIRTVLPEVPVVAFDHFFSTEIDSVVLNNRDAGRIATEHLIRHGYKNVVCVTGRPEIYSFQERIVGYKEAMSNHGLKPNLIIAPGYEQLRFALAAAIRSKTRPAGMLSLSDFATLTILSTFSELGLKTPDTVPLVGFDDFGFAPLVDPPLTIVRQPVESMVRYAMDALFRRIDGESPEAAQMLMLAGELICRKSCGCG